jgi:hypothetical protein
VLPAAGTDSLCAWTVGFILQSGHPYTVYPSRWQNESQMAVQFAGFVTMALHRERFSDNF